MAQYSSRSCSPTYIIVGILKMVNNSKRIRIKFVMNKQPPSPLLFFVKCQITWIYQHRDLDPPHWRFKICELSFYSTKAQWKGMSSDSIMHALYDWNPNHFIMNLKLCYGGPSMIWAFVCYLLLTAWSGFIVMYIKSTP